MAAPPAKYNNEEQRVVIGFLWLKDGSEAEIPIDSKHNMKTVRYQKDVCMSGWRSVKKAG